MGLAIFIEPQGDLKANLLMWKAKVEENFPKQFYCSHPPHSTLIHVNVIQEKMAIEAIGKIVKNINEFKNKVVETDVFWNDDATGGGHTLFWKIQTSQVLFDLQKQIAEVLHPFIAETTMPEFVQNNPLFKESLDRYGFPFVGDHWIPHFTIASLQTDQNDPLIEEFLNQVGDYEMGVTEVSCWRVENGQHTCLESYKLL